MTGKVNFHSGVVYETQMDTMTELNEADRLAISKDAFGFGIRNGMEGAARVNSTSPLSLNVSVTHATSAVDGEAVVRDRGGRTCRWSATQLVNCAVDYLGATTVNDITTGKGRWVSIYACHDVQLAQPEQDLTGATVYFQELDAVTFHVVKGSLMDLVADPDNGGEMIPDGARPSRPASTSEFPYIGDAVKLCDIRLVYDGGQPTTIDVSTDCYYDEREDWVRDTFDHILVTSGYPGTYPGSSGQFVAGNPREAIIELLEWFDGYFADYGVEDFWALIGASDGQTWRDGIMLNVSSDATVKSVVEQVITDLASETASIPGAERVGVDAHTSTPNGYLIQTAGSVRDRLQGIANYVDNDMKALLDHKDDTSDAHDASAISVVSPLPEANWYQMIGSTVQECLEHLAENLDKAVTIEGGGTIVEEATLAVLGTFIAPNSTISDLSSNAIELTGGYGAVGGGTTITGTSFQSDGSGTFGTNLQVDGNLGVDGHVIFDADDVANVAFDADVAFTRLVHPCAATGSGAAEFSSATANWQVEATGDIVYFPIEAAIGAKIDEVQMYVYNPAGAISLGVTCSVYKLAVGQAGPGTVVATGSDTISAGGGSGVADSITLDCSDEVIASGYSYMAIVWVTSTDGGGTAGMKCTGMRVQYKRTRIVV